MPQRPSPRSYDQWCDLALALDHLGDRWTLLIVRELLAGPRRYTDLRANLPGIATNLLAQRLKDLERDGIISRRDLPPPTPAVLYELTPNGAELESAVLDLTRWGSRLMPTERPAATRPSWLALALRAVLEPRLDPAMPDLDVVVMGTDETPIRLTLQRGHLAIQPGAQAPPGTPLLSGDPHALLAVATGATTLAAARRAKELTIRAPRPTLDALDALLRPADQGAA